MFELTEGIVKSVDWDIEATPNPHQDTHIILHLETGQTLRIQVENLDQYDRDDRTYITTELREPNRY